MTETGRLTDAVFGRDSLRCKRYCGIDPAVHAMSLEPPKLSASEAERASRATAYLLTQICASTWKPRLFRPEPARSAGQWVARLHADTVRRRNGFGRRCLRDVGCDGYRSYHRRRRQSQAPRRKTRPSRPRLQPRLTRRQLRRRQRRLRYHRRRLQFRQRPHRCRQHQRRCRQLPAPSLRRRHRYHQHQRRCRQRPPRCLSSRLPAWS